MPLALVPVAPVLAAGLVDINPGLTIWTGITFIVLLIVLGTFAWGSVVAMLDEREKNSREASDEAKRERAEAERMMAEQKEALSQARREAAELAKKNQAEMEAFRADLAARAKKEADELVASARKQID